MLDLLREFQMLAMRLNFTAAARELHISQSSLSRHMTELEADLGFALFERRGPVVLTSAGEHLLEGIPDVLGACDRLIEESRQLSASARTTLSVAMLTLEGATSWMVYSVLASMQATYPNFAYSVFDDRNCTITEAVENGQADVGLLIYKPQTLSDDLALECVQRAPYVAWVHKESSLPSRVGTPAELVDHVLVQSTSKRFEDWNNACLFRFTRMGLMPRRRIKSVNSLAELLVAFQKDEFIFVTNSHSELDRYNVHVRKVTFEDEQSALTPVYLVYKKRTTNSALQAFVDLCKKWNPEY